MLDTQYWGYFQRKRKDHNAISLENVDGFIKDFWKFHMAKRLVQSTYIVHKICKIVKEFPLRQM